jgi:hypothetical protein
VFRKKLKELLNMMGVTDIDEELLDSLQRQLFQFLEFDDMFAGGITFKTGSILTTIQVQNYQEIRDRIHYKYRNGEPSERLNLRLSITSLCLYLKEDRKCQITDENCDFQPKWWECEIVQASCKDNNEEWK